MSGQANRRYLACERIECPRTAWGIGSWDTSQDKRAECTKAVRDIEKES
jgi:hypothetical protein